MSSGYKDYLAYLSSAQNFSNKTQNAVGLVDPDEGSLQEVVDNIPLAVFNSKGAERLKQFMEDYRQVQKKTFISDPDVKVFGTGV